MGVNGREFFIKKTLEFFKNTFIFFKNTSIFFDRPLACAYLHCFKKITVRNDCQAMDFIKFAFVVYLKQKGL